MEQITKGAKTIRKTITWKVTTNQQTHLTQVTTQIRYICYKHKTGILPVCQTTVGYRSHPWSQQWKNIHLLVMVRPDQLPSLWLTQISHHLLHDQTPENQQMCDKIIRNKTLDTQAKTWSGNIFFSYFYIVIFNINNTNIMVLQLDMF